MYRRDALSALGAERMPDLCESMYGTRLAKMNEQQDDEEQDPQD